MVTGHFNELRSCANLVVALRLDVVDFLTSVKELTGALEVVLHEVNVFFIVLHVDTRVPNDQDTKLVEAFSHLLALNSSKLLRLRVGAGCSLPSKVGLEVDDRHLSEFLTNNFSALRDSSANLFGHWLFDLN
jgi:hypothetical protein